MIAVGCTTPGRRHDRVPARRRARVGPDARRGGRRTETGGGRPRPDRSGGRRGHGADRGDRRRRRRRAVRVHDGARRVAVGRARSDRAAGPRRDTGDRPAGPGVDGAGRRRRRRAGRMEAACVRLPGDVAALGLRLLLAVADGAEVLLVEGGGAAVLRVARALGGRPLPVLPLPDGDAVTALLGACELDVDVPVPSLEEPERSLVSSLLRPMALVTPHRLGGGRPGAGVRRGGRRHRRRVAGGARGGRRGRPRGAAGGREPSVASRGRAVSYMCAISCSTRSSLERNGSLQSTVRCA